MATGGQKRTRGERIAALDLPPSQWERAWENLSRRDVLGRIILGLLAAAVMCCIVRGWDPPFAYRTGWTPSRAIVARVPFAKRDANLTDANRKAARSQVRFTYVQDPQPLIDLRAELRNTVTKLTEAASLDEVEPALWREFRLPSGDDAAPSTEDPEEQFRQFREQFAGPEKLARLERALAAAFMPFEQRGLLNEPYKELGPCNPDEILVHPKGAPEPLRSFKITDVLIGTKKVIQQSLRAQFDSREVADRLFNWLRERIKPTLSPDVAATSKAMDEAERKVEDAILQYKAGQTLVSGSEPLTPDQLDLLKLEYAASMDQRSSSEKLARAAAILAMIFAILVLCGIYMRYRQRGPLDNVTRLLVILLMAIAVVGVARLVAEDNWRAELIPVMLFGMTMTIVYRRELGLLLSAICALLVVFAVGHGLNEFLLLVGVTTVANINLGTIRSRRKLIYVGLLAGGVAFLLEIGLALISDQGLSEPLLTDAARMALWALTACFLMTGLLPFIEQLFGVLTDLSLLELGDVSHPLLQELVRRAPSTYSHSLTVGSIAEAAADAIGARGLLVRVGAYFHDIGKMLKPAYFVENQGSEGSMHEGLVPAMSTLVIIAHIKDGSDLARQYHLPQPIIDLVVQHHGTTLVEYFFDRAHERSQSDPNGAEPDETSFRYPGPKPQTKEAAVLMLADAVESASRTLVDPTPARIESVVRVLAERRLHDGQFDESGLTLRELRTIERSLVMSLTSIYHGRIKYPEQKTA